MPASIILGQPHPFLLDRRLSEGALLIIFPGYLGICSILDRPTPHEINEHRQSHNMRIGLAPAGDHTCFVIMKVGNLNWADMPFTLGVDQPDLLPPREPDAGYVWHYELVDLAGIVHSLGIFTVTPTFSALFEQQIAKLRKNLWMFSPAKHQAEIAAFYRHYPDQNRMTPAAIIIEKAGMRFPR